MKIVCISDTHNTHESMPPLPEGDVLVHAGDMTMSGKLFELRKTTNYLLDQARTFKHVVCIAGNHDFACEAFMKEQDENMLRTDFFYEPNVHYLRDSEVTLDGVKFYGSPWQPEFFDWAFNLPRGLELGRKWAMIPVNTDVLLTHGPPMGILDRVGAEHVGCADLRQAVEYIKPKVHVFGHIHCGYGQQHCKGTTFINASVTNEKYHAVNDPIVVEI